MTDATRSFPLLHSRGATRTGPALAELTPAPWITYAQHPRVRALPPRARNPRTWAVGACVPRRPRELLFLGPDPCCSAGVHLFQTDAEEEI
jgi:hypothetical protein